MRKIDLNEYTLSKNILCVSKKALDEINGGCTLRVSKCYGSYYISSVISKCSYYSTHKNVLLAFAKKYGVTGKYKITGVTGGTITEV